MRSPRSAQRRRTPPSILRSGPSSTRFATSLDWASARRGRRPGRGRSASPAKPSILERCIKPRGVCRSMPPAGAANRREGPSSPMAIVRRRRAYLASAVRAAAAGNCEILRSLRVISMAGMLPSPRINGMLHRVTFAPLWESPRSQVLGRLVSLRSLHGALHGGDRLFSRLEG
jgi:hypothetical protein